MGLLLLLPQSTPRRKPGRPNTADMHAAAAAAAAGKQEVAEPLGRPDAKRVSLQFNYIQDDSLAQLKRNLKKNVLDCF
jgi:hypothetical protein